jgi:hypothetical protein
MYKQYRMHTYANSMYTHTCFRVWLTCMMQFMNFVAGMKLLATKLTPYALAIANMRVALEPKSRVKVNRWTWPASRRIGKQWRKSGERGQREALPFRCNNGKCCFPRVLFLGVRGHYIGSNYPRAYPRSNTCSLGARAILSNSPTSHKTPN